MVRINEVTIETLKAYCRVDWTEEDDLFYAILTAGRQFILSQTGMTAAEADEKEDLTIALLILGTEMYENRSYTMSTNRTVNINPAVDAIIGQYRMNFL